MEHRRIAVGDMKPGDTFQGCYILESAAVRRDKTDKQYLNATLTDKTGSINAKKWDFTGSIEEGRNGNVVEILGRVKEFNGAPQVTIDKLQFDVPESEIHPEELIPSAPIDMERELSDIRSLVDSIADTDYRAVCLKLLEEHLAEFRSIPAAKNVHHAFYGGLLMHTGSMLRMADFLAGLYGEVIDRSLLLAGTLLHDMAKGEEFALSQLGLVSDYTVKGNLLGHLVMGARNIDIAARELGIPEEKSVLLQHMILSHHGQPEFGAAVVPQCAESELLAYIDQIDSRMELYRETLSSVPAGKFSSYIPHLEKRIYRHS